MRRQHPAVDRGASRHRQHPGNEKRLLRQQEQDARKRRRRHAAKVGLNAGNSSVGANRRSQTKRSNLSMDEIGLQLARKVWWIVTGKLR